MKREPQGMLNCSEQSPARVIPGMVGALWRADSWEDSADCQLSFSLRFLFFRVDPVLDYHLE